MSSPDAKRARLSSTNTDIKMSTTTDHPEAVYNPSTSASLGQYHSTHTSSIQDVSAYWSELATSKLDWFAPFPKGAAVTGECECCFHADNLYGYIFGSTLFFISNQFLNLYNHIL